MKFMKLGCKPDTFQSQGKYTRYIASELPTDITVVIGDVRFFLHKFPLLSKSNLLHGLILKASEENSDEVRIDDIPGGALAFELCAKFCYGIAVTLNAHNVFVARCAAMFLEMTEDIERGNLIYKLEVFINSSVLRSWKDSIIALQTTTSLPSWSEEIQIVGRCIESIASKTSLDTSDVHWSYTYTRKSLTSPAEDRSVPEDWWVEDLTDLDINLFEKVMVAIVAESRHGTRMLPRSNVVGVALRTYAYRWLPTDLTNIGNHHRSVIETIIRLLPSDDKLSGCPCSFLSTLLKLANIVGIDASRRDELLDRISWQLEKASIKDLMVPTTSNPDSAVYNANLLQDLVGRFLMQENLNSNQCISHESLMAVGKLIDGCLLQLASDPAQQLTSFIDLSRALPDSCRLIHDGLYAAIDTYLQEHADLTKDEKKRICGVIDVRKLSPKACLHAMQNERLPLRFIVQVLYFRQLRTAADNVSKEPDWEKYGEVKHEIMEEEEEEDRRLSSIKDTNGSHGKINSDVTAGGGGFLLPSRSRRILKKFWIGKSQKCEIKNKTISSEETSATGSQSPLVSVAPGESKSTGSSSRNRRYSVS